MREIKFRGWHKKIGEMANVDTIHSNGYIHLSPITKISSDSKMFRSEEIELMQYTGLKDKNGKEIYERDIVKYKEMEGFDCEDDDYMIHGSERIGKVIFEDGQFTPREYYHYCEDGFYAWRRHSFEVIGNIYENPELLK